MDAENYYEMFIKPLAGRKHLRVRLVDNKLMLSELQDMSIECKELENKKSKRAQVIAMLKGCTNDAFDKAAKSALEVLNEPCRFGDVNKKVESKKQWLFSIVIFSLEMILYMARWQLSTFTMTPVILFAKHIGIINSWEQVALANLISAPFFFFIDKFILVYVRKLLLRLINWLKRKRAERVKQI